MTRLGRRELLIGIAVVLSGQIITIYAVYRMTLTRGPAAAAVPAPAQVKPTLVQPPGGFARRFSATDRAPSSDPSGAPDQAPAPPPPRAPVVRPSPRTAWSDRKLDEAGEKLAEEVSRPPDDLRLFADERGRVTESAQRDLRAGRAAADQLAQRLGIAGDGQDLLGQVLVGFMVKRVAMRESFKGTSVTPQAIDDAARTDALTSVQHAFGDEARQAVATALPGLPDLTQDLPDAPR